MKHTKLGYSYQVMKCYNELLGLEEVVKHFKINVQRKHVFSRCMVCNCDEFLIASKMDMMRLKYPEDDEIPDELKGFVMEAEKYLHVEIPENKSLWSASRYMGQEVTKYDAIIEATKIGYGTLEHFQTFYICQKCAKIYWDGGHYSNTCGGRLDHIFNLFPDAEK